MAARRIAPKRLERGIKQDVMKVLTAPDIYPFMPVQMGYGKAGLDFHCAIVVRGLCVAFWVETKKTDPRTGAHTELTDRQEQLVADLRGRMKAKVFVIYNWVGVMELEKWIALMRSKN